MRVLLVDANKQDAEQIRKLFFDANLANTELERVESFDLGLERVAAGGFDVLLLDTDLLTKGVEDALSSVQDRNPALPVIMLSELDKVLTAVDAVRAGAQDYLIKGQIEAPLLARTLRYAVEQKKTERERTELEHFRKREIRRTNGLLETLRTLSKNDLSTDNALQMVADTIRDAFQCPQETSVRIRLADLAAETTDFSQSQHSLTSRITVSGTPVGALEAHMSEGSFPPGQEPFRPQEKDLLDAAATALGLYAQSMGAVDAMREADIQYELAMESSRIGPWECNLQTNQMSFSPEWKRQIGYDDDEIKGGAEEWESRIHPQDRARVLGQWESYLKGETSEYRTEFRMRHKDESDIWVYARGSMIRGRDGKPLRMVGCHVDVSEIHRLREEKEALEVQLNQIQRLETIGRLATGIAHKFNHILSLTAGYAELAMLKVSDNPVMQSQLQKVIDASHQGGEFVQQILNMSRLREEEPWQPFDIVQLAGDALKFLRDSTPATVETRWDFGVDEGIVHGSAMHIYQVLLTLAMVLREAVENSTGVLEMKLTETRLPSTTRRTPPGGKAGKYFVLVLRAEGRLIETGAVAGRQTAETDGVPPVSGRAFQRAALQSIIKAHHGELSLLEDSVEEIAFEILLPRFHPDRVEAPPAAETAGASEELKILVVDDEAEIVSLTKQLLEWFGHESVGFTDPREAVTRFRNQPDAFSLMITDLNMPHMTGLELSAEIQKIRPDLPIVLSTAFNDLVSPDTIKDKGIRELLLKPVAAGQLVETVQRILGDPEQPPSQGPSREGP